MAKACGYWREGEEARFWKMTGQQSQRDPHGQRHRHGPASIREGFNSVYLKEVAAVYFSNRALNYYLWNTCSMKCLSYFHLSYLNKDRELISFQSMSMLSTVSWTDLGAVFCDQDDYCHVKHNPRRLL